MASQVLAAGGDSYKITEHVEIETNQNSPDMTPDAPDDAAFGERRPSDTMKIDCDSLDAPSWLKDGLKKLDLNGDGLEKSELDDMLRRLALEKQKSSDNNPEIHYEHMPEVVQEVLRKWDHDLSGSVSVGELIGAAKAQQQLAKENRIVKRLLFASVIVIVALAIMNFLMSLAAVEQGKDFNPSEGSQDEAASRRVLQESYWGRRLEEGQRRFQRRLMDATGEAEGEGEGEDTDGEAEGEAKAPGSSKGALVNKGDGSNVNVAMNLHEFEDLNEFVNDRNPMHETCSEFHSFDQHGKPETRKIVNSEFLPDGPLKIKLADGDEVTVDSNGRIRRQPQDKSLPPKTIGPHPPKPKLFAAEPPAYLGKLRCAALPIDKPTVKGGRVPKLKEVCEKVDGEVVCSKERFNKFVDRMNAASKKLNQKHLSPDEANKAFDERDCNKDGELSQKEFEADIACPELHPHRRRLHGSHMPFAQRRALELQKFRRRRLRRLNANLTRNDDWEVDEWIVGDHGFDGEFGTVLDHNAAAAFLEGTGMANNDMEDLSQAIAAFEECDKDRNGFVSDAEKKECSPEEKWDKPKDGSLEAAPESKSCSPPGKKTGGVNFDTMKKENYARECIDNFYSMDKNWDGKVTDEESIDFWVPPEDVTLQKICEANNLICSKTGLFKKEEILNYDPTFNPIALDMKDHNGDGLILKNELRRDDKWDLAVPPIFSYDIKDEEVYWDPLEHDSTWEWDDTNDPDLRAGNDTGRVLESNRLAQRRLQSRLDSDGASFRSLFDGKTRVSRLRYLYEIAIQPVLEKRHHRRERRRLQKELNHRRLERKLLDHEPGRYEEWVENRRLTAENHRRRLEETKLRKVYERKRHDFAALPDEELESLDVPFINSHRYRRLQAAFSHFPTEHRRLLSIHHKSTSEPIKMGRQLHEQDEKLATFMSDTAFKVDVTAQELKGAVDYVNEKKDEIMDPEVVEDLKASPSTFNSFRYEATEPEDYNDSPFPTGSKLLGGEALIKAVTKVKGVKREKAKKIVRRHLKKHRKRHGRRLQSIAARDPLRQRRLHQTGAAGTAPDNEPGKDPEMEGFDHVDMCGWLELTSPTMTHAPLMATDGVREAFWRGDANYCVPQDEQARAMFGIDSNTPEADITIENRDRVLNVATMKSVPALDDKIKMDFGTFLVNELHNAHELPAEERLTPPLVPAVPTCKEDSDPTNVSGSCHQVPQVLDVASAGPALRYDEIGPGCAKECCKTGVAADCHGPNRIKPCDCLRKKKKVAKKVVNKFFKRKGGKKGAKKMKKRAYKHARKNRKKNNKAKRMGKKERRLLHEGHQLAHHTRRRLKREHCEQKRFEWVCGENIACAWNAVTQKCVAATSTEQSSACAIYGDYDSANCDSVEGCGAEWDWVTGVNFKCKACREFSVDDCWTPQCIVEGGRCTSVATAMNANGGSGAGGDVDFDSVCAVALNPADAFAVATGMTNPTQFDSDSELQASLNGITSPSDREMFDELVKAPGISPEFRDNVELIEWEEYPMDPIELQEFMWEEWDGEDFLRRLQDGEWEEWSDEDFLDDWGMGADSFEDESWLITDELDWNDDGYIGTDEIWDFSRKCSEGQGAAGDFNEDFCDQATSGGGIMESFSGASTFGAGESEPWDEPAGDTGAAAAGGGQKVPLDDFDDLLGQGDDFDYEGKIMASEFKCFQATVNNVGPEESGPLFEKLSGAPADGVDMETMIQPSETDAVHAATTGEQITPAYKDKMAEREMWMEEVEISQDCVDQNRYQNAETFVMDFVTTRRRQRRRMRRLHEEDNWESWDSSWDSSEDDQGFDDLELEFHEMPTTISGYGNRELKDSLDETETCLNRIAKAYEELGEKENANKAKDWAYRAGNATAALPIDPVTLTDSVAMPADIHFFWNDMEPMTPECGVAINDDVIPCDELVDKQDPEEFLGAQDHWCDNGVGDCVVDFADPGVTQDFYTAEWDPDTGLADTTYYHVPPGEAGKPINPCYDRFIRKHAHCWQITEDEFRSALQGAVNTAATRGGEEFHNHCVQMDPWMDGIDSFCRSQGDEKPGLSDREITRIWEKVRHETTNTIPIPHYDCFEVYGDEFGYASPVNACPMDAAGKCVGGAAAPSVPIDLFAKCSFANSMQRINQLLHDFAYMSASEYAAISTVRRLRESSHHAQKLSPETRRLLEVEENEGKSSGIFTRFERRSKARKTRRKRVQGYRRRALKRDRRRRLEEGEVIDEVAEDTNEDDLISGLDHALRELYTQDYGNYADNAFMFAEDSAWEERYQKLLEKRERELLDDVNLLLHSIQQWDYTWLMEEIRYLYFSADPAKQCATLIWSNTYGELIEAERLKVQNCVKPALKGVSMEIVEMVHGVVEGWNSPRDLVSYLGLDTPDTAQDKAKFWAENHASFHGYGPGNGKCKCPCKLDTMLHHPTALTTENCHGDVTIAGAAKNVCEYYNAAEAFGYIDTDDCFSTFTYQRRRLEQVELKKEQDAESCMTINGDKFCKVSDDNAGSLRKLQGTRSLENSKKSSDGLTKKTRKELKRTKNRRGRKGSKHVKRHFVNEKSERKRQKGSFSAWKRKKGIARRRRR